MTSCPRTSSFRTTYRATRMPTRSADRAQDDRDLQRHRKALGTGGWPASPILADESGPGIAFVGDRHAGEPVAPGVRSFGPSRRPNAPGSRSRWPRPSRSIAWSSLTRSTTRSRSATSSLPTTGHTSDRRGAVAGAGPRRVAPAVDEATTRSLLDGLFELRSPPRPGESTRSPSSARPRTVHSGLRARRADSASLGLRTEPTHWVPWDRFELVSAGLIEAEDEFRDVSAPGWISGINSGTRLLTGRNPSPAQKPARCASPATRRPRSCSSARTRGSRFGSSPRR